MKKCLSVLLALILVMSSMTLVVHAEPVDLSDSGEDTDLAETGVGSVESAISWAISIANDDSHGYSQRRRTGPDYDCSSFVSTAFKQAGFALDGTENTGTMKNAFVNAGFTWIPASSIADYPAKSTNLKRGDVLLGSGHTALYIGNDKIVHAINGTYDKYDDGHPGDQTGNEIAVKPFSSSSYSRVGGWLGVLRFESISAIDLGSKFYANIVPTATDTSGLASTGTNEDLAETGGVTLLWPVEGHTSLSRGFAKHNNKAIDINDASITGATIRAALGGTVVKKFTCSHNTYPNFPKCCYGYGTGLAIKGTDNRYYCYGHMQYGSIPSSIEEGSKIIQGQIIGKVGKTGCCDGPCLHFEICKNFWPNSGFVNPEEETYIYSTVNPQDLGAKFYANIVPTGAGSLAVTANGANTNGTNVSLATLDYSDSQKWLFERKDGNAYKITNVQKNKCLDVDNYGTANGTNIQLWSSNDSSAQRWYIVKNGAGYRLVPKCTPGSCLDITGGKLTAGTNIEEWTQNDSAAQRFNIIKTVDHKDIGTNFYANIFVTDDQSLSVTVAEDDNVYIDKTTYEDNQKWYFERQNDKTYKITNIKSGWCLDLYGNKGDLNTNVHTHNDNGNNAQRWYIVTNGSGYTFVPKSYIDKAIDINGGKLLAGTNLKEYTANQTAAQRFTISKTVNHKDIGERFYANIVSNDPAYSITADADYNVSLQLSNGNNNQLWQFERNSDKTYRITNVLYERCLDVNGGYTDNGTNIKVYTPNNSNAQKWYVIINGSGYSLVPKCSIASALDVYGGVFEAGTNIQEWGIKLHDAQRVYINKTVYVKPELVQLSESEVQIEVGNTRLLSVVVEPTEANQSVIWNSDNESVATVDENGIVTAHDIGTAWISAITVNGLMTRCEVTVFEPTVSPEYILMSDDGLYIDVDQTWQLNASVFPEEANQTVIWRSENEEIATVDEAGIVTGIGEGETIICAQTEDGSAQAYCSVYVYPPYVEPEYVEENGFGGLVNNDGTVYLFFYNGDARDIIIPSTIEGRVVSEISYYLLQYENDYDSVTVPKTISTIGFRAFGYFVDYPDEETVTEYKLDHVIIKGYNGSAAESYASEYGFTFVALDDTTPTEPTAIILGDVDGDGQVTIIDATCIQRHLAELPTFAFNEKAADSDEDGQLTIIDATCIQRHLAELKTNDNIGKPIK